MYSMKNQSDKKQQIFGRSSFLDYLVTQDGQQVDTQAGDPAPQQQHHSTTLDGVGNDVTNLIHFFVSCTQRCVAYGVDEL